MTTQRRIITVLICILLALHGIARCDDKIRRGMFITVLQDPPVLSSRSEIFGMIEFAKSAHVDTLFVQIYRANQAWFPSNIADAGPYKKCVDKVSEDPFALLIKEAHAAGIQVHAWLNMLSISRNTDSVFLKKYGTSILTQNLHKKNTIQDYRIDNQYFLEPGDLRIREELVSMVGEILDAYPDLDGIQFDYIRYPDMHPEYGYTEMNIERFKKATGIDTIEEDSRAWKDWKRSQVTELLAALAAKARSMRPSIQVSATGCAPYSRALYEAYQDWPSWIERGLVDFVTVMSYSPVPSIFGRYITELKKRSIDFNKINIAIGAYQLVRSPELFAREYRLCEDARPRSCVIFHYESVAESPALTSFLTTGRIARKSEPHKQSFTNFTPKSPARRSHKDIFSAL